MITEIQVKDFKSYRHGVLPLAPLTVLIGANASGKSNIIEAIRLLSEIAGGQRLMLLGRTTRSSLRSFRGKTHELGYQGQDSFQLICKIEPGLHHAWNQLEMTLQVDEHRDAFVSQEKITNADKDSPLYKIVSEPRGAGGDVFVEYDDLTIEHQKLKVVCSGHMAIFTQLLSEIRFPDTASESRHKIPLITNDYVKALRNIISIEPEPHVMRSHGYADHPLLDKHGENLSGILYQLCRDQNKKTKILDFIESLPEQDIKDIDFYETGHGEVMLKLTETFGDVETIYDVTTLSDGTLRVLAIAAAIFSAPKQSLVIIEEIDNGIHPSRIKTLFAKINTIAQERQLRILTTSHNPALLDSLPDEAGPDAVFCYRSPEDGSSKLVRLRDIRDYVELMVQGSVGHLMTHGILERFVKYHPEPEEKRRRALEWLKKMRKEVENVG
ncbi:MAG: ATP-binding protein [Cyanobacteria bacterium P01_G01_bin.54]